MNKEKVCFKLTRKNCKKLLGILEMFGEPVYNGDKDRWSRGVLYSGDKYATIDTFGDWRGVTKHQLTDWYPDKKVVKPRKLRNVLAKEHLKKGDVCVFKQEGKEHIYRVDKISEGNYPYVHNEKHNVAIYFDNFIRYATDEEKAMLEPKLQISEVDPVETKCGIVEGFTRYTREVWVNHYSDQEFHVHKKKSTADLHCHLNGNLGRHVKTIKATLTYDIPMTKV